MIKTKLFDGYSEERWNGFQKYQGVDKQINDFLEIRPEVNLIDIKLCPSVEGHQEDGISTKVKALVIYEE